MRDEVKLTETISRFGPLYGNSSQIRSWLTRVDPGLETTLTQKNTSKSHYDLYAATADLPPTTTRRSIIICTSPRTGSTLLAEALGQFPGFGRPAEYFQTATWERRFPRWGCKTFAEFVSTVKTNRTDSTGTFGLKFFWQDVPYLLEECREPRPAELLRHYLRPDSNSAQEMYRILRDKFDQLLPGIRYIYLQRRDKVAQAVSTLIAAQTSRWRSTDQLTKHIAPLYSYPAVRALCCWYEICDQYWQAYFRYNKLEPFNIDYEDLQADLTNQIIATTKHFGVYPLSQVEIPQLAIQRDRLTTAMVTRFLAESAADQ